MSAHKLTHVAEAKDGAALIDHIYMDAMGFGMGCSCLQLTFQSCNIAEARRLYDALVPVAPLMVSEMNRPPESDVYCRYSLHSLRPVRSGAATLPT